jgi:hypothetical protein
MKEKAITRNLLAVLLIGGLFGMAGCGGKQEVQPEPQPVPEVTPEPTPVQDQRYSVVRGDTLWDIAGMADIYGDNFQWPLIFKANRDQIEDPDIIEIGQEFAISRSWSQEEINTAIENAKRTPRYKKHRKPRKRLPIEY